MIMKERRKKSGGNPTMFTKLKDISSWIGLFSAIIVPLYMLYGWNESQIIKKHNTKITIKKTVKDLKEVNENLIIMDSENKVQHTALNNSIEEIRGSVNSIDKKINQLILQKKYTDFEKIKGKNIFLDGVAIN